MVGQAEEQPDGLHWPCRDYVMDGVRHVFDLQSLCANSTQTEQTAPLPAQQIQLVKEGAHQGLLRKIRSALKPGESLQEEPVSLSEELREELKRSATLPAERKSSSPALLCFFFPPLKKIPSFSLQ